MAIDIPPIVVHLFYLLPKLVLKPLLLYAAIRISAVDAPTWTTIAACLLTQPAFFLVSLAYRAHSQRSFAKSHGAVTVPRIKGNMVQTSRAIMKSFMQNPIPGDIFHEWAGIYGNTYTYDVLGESRIYTIEPEHVKAILATQFDKFVKGEALHDQWETLLGDGIFNSDGKVWKFHRGMTRPFFSKDRISDFDNFDRHATTCISLIKERMSKGEAVDFQDAIGRFTLDSASEYLFGADLKSLDAGLTCLPGMTNTEHHLNHPSNQFVSAFHEAQYYVNRRNKLGPYWRLLEPWRDESKTRRAIMDIFLDPLLDEALKKKKALNRNEEKGIVEEDTLNLLDHLVRDTDDATMVKDELINMLLAGRDTTAGTLCWAVYMLAENPEMAKRLRDDIMSKFGPEARPTYKQLREIKYLRAFIDETLRLFPSVPYDARVCNEDTVFPGVDGKPSIFIPKKNRFMYSAYWMQRRTDLWGPDALKFDPDRWLDERLQKYYLTNPYMFVPFNAGPRICLGQQFAYNEMSFFLVRLLQNFSEFDLAADIQPESSKTRRSWVQSTSDWNLTFKINLTMSVKEGMWIRMK